MVFHNNTGVSLNIYLVIFITLIAALLASFAQLLYKRGMSERIAKIRHSLKLIRNKTIVIGAILYLVSLAIYLYALSNAPLSIVYPTFASTFIFISLISWLYLKERMNVKRIAGTLLVFLGVVIIAISVA